MKPMVFAVFFLMAAALSAQAPPAAAVQAGQATFKERCAVCHGDRGKGNGPAAVALKHPPADLTQLSKKNGGTFSRADVMRFIDGERPVPAHGPRHMPVWGEVFREERTDSEARMRILALTSFIESIQAK